MRILYIITQGEQGGGQKNVLDLATGMNEKGHEVHVAVGRIENEGDKWLHRELEKLDFKKENLIEISSLQREISPKEDLCACFQIRNLLKKIKPDIVHLHSSKAGVVGSVAAWMYNFSGRTKTVYTVHGFVFLEPMSTWKKYFYIFLEFISSSLRNFTILISPLDVSAGKKYFIIRQNNPRGSSWKIIYNGLDEKIKGKMLDKLDAREHILEKVSTSTNLSIQRRGDMQITGTISNLYKTKGLEYLIEASKKVLEKFPNTIFVVLGFGPENYKQELQERIKKNHLENNFFLLGKTPDAFKYLKAFDVFTLTSVKEGLPYTLLEAKMAGVPMVASSVGGIPEMAKYFPINLVEAKNVEQIKNKIVEILENLEKFKSGDNLPEIFSVKNMMSETESIYQSLIQ